MCGICGLVSLNGTSPPDPAVLASMNDALVHRGPDSEGVVVDGPVGLAARRLSIIDLAGGDQPMSSEDGSVTVVHNGEIYNHGALRERLAERGHAFATRCDTEVLVHGYEEHGADFVRALRGMFAFSLWDARRGRLVIARDRFGIKPLYYRVADGQLSFASELKALVRQPGFVPQISADAVAAFLTFNSIPSPLAIYEGVRKLPAGHLLEWNGGPDVALREYAVMRPEPVGRLRTESQDELAAELRERLRDSVRAHLVSDVPVGVLLSGGIDSAALVALAAEESSERVRTFSIGFSERSFNELDHARLVADRYGTDHHELVVTPDAMELFPAIVETFDEPFADSSALPTYLVSQLAAKHVKVALSGEGGDELFGGYYTYVADLLASRLGPLPALARPLVERLPSSSEKASFDYKAKRFVRGARLAPLERHHAWKEIFSAEARAELLGARRPSGDPLDPYRARYAASAGAEPLARLQDVDLGIYLVDDLLVKTDRASMAHSLEARVPFLDRQLAEFALALPTRHKVRGFSKKRLLRRSLEPILPREIVHGKKQGFSIPAAAWLRGELRDFAQDALSPDGLRRQGWLEPKAVTRVLDAHLSGREDLSRQLWGLLAFTVWHDRCHDSAGSPERARR
jgi:asparagine synthase (glutamine-hydrolysing)